MPPTHAGAQVLGGKHLDGQVWVHLADDLHRTSVGEVCVLFTITPWLAKNWNIFSQTTQWIRGTVLDAPPRTHQSTRCYNAIILSVSSRGMPRLCDAAYRVGLSQVPKICMPWGDVDDGELTRPARKQMILTLLRMTDTLP